MMNELHSNSHYCCKHEDNVFVKHVHNWVKKCFKITILYILLGGSINHLITKLDLVYL